MPNPFRDAMLDLKCRKCGYETRETLGRLETGPAIRCRRCGVVTRYDGSSPLRATMRKIDRGLADLQRTFRKFGGR